MPSQASFKVTKLVLLPGMDGTGDLFAPFVAALDESIAPVVVSYPTTETLDYDQLVCYVRRRLPKGEPFFLLGESFSGPIAVSIAAEMPENLQGIVLAASFVSSPIPWAGQLGKFATALPLSLLPVRLLAFALFGRFSTSHWQLLLARALSQVAPGVIKARMRAVLEVDVRAAARQVRVPALYLQAMEDRVVRGSAGRAIQKYIPGLSTQRFAAPHMLLQVGSVDAAIAVKKFIAQANRCVS